MSFTISRSPRAPRGERDASSGDASRRALSQDPHGCAPRRACGKKSGEIHDELKEKFTTPPACPPSPRLSVANETPRIPSTVIVSRRSLTAFTNATGGGYKGFCDYEEIKAAIKECDGLDGAAGGVLRRVRVRRRPRHALPRAFPGIEKKQRKAWNEFSRPRTVCARLPRRVARRHTRSRRAFRGRDLAERPAEASGELGSRSEHRHAPCSINSRIIARDDETKRARDVSPLAARDSADDAAKINREPTVSNFTNSAGCAIFPISRGRKPTSRNLQISSRRLSQTQLMCGAPE